MDPDKRVYIGLLIVWSALSLFLSGCTSKRNPGSIVYRLKWLYNVSAAGDIWAQESGIFRSYGLTVDIREGGPEQDAIKDLELGRAQFGVASADQVIRAVAKGARVVVLAQIFQINPLQWIYIKRNGLVVKRPQDLKGLCIGVTYGGNDEAILMSLLRQYRISPDDLKLYAVHCDLNPFWRGKVDLWPVYKNIEGIIFQEKMAKNGEQACFFDPSTAGIRFVANSLITSKKVYMERPKVVRDFTEAILEGWRGAMDPRKKSRVAEAIHRLDPDTPISIIEKQIDATRALVIPRGNRDIGAIDRRAWEQTRDILLAQGLISHRVDIRPLLAGPPP